MTKSILLLIFSISILFGCRDDNTPLPAFGINDYSGTWEITSDTVFASWDSSFFKVYKDQSDKYIRISKDSISCGWNGEGVGIDEKFTRYISLKSDTIEVRENRLNTNVYFRVLPLNSSTFEIYRNNDAYLLHRYSVKKIN